MLKYSYFFINKRCRSGNNWRQWMMESFSLKLNVANVIVSTFRQYQTVILDRYIKRYNNNIIIIIIILLLLLMLHALLVSLSPWMYCATVLVYLLQAYSTGLCYDGVDCCPIIIFTTKQSNPSEVAPTWWRCLRLSPNNCMLSSVAKHMFSQLFFM